MHERERASVLLLMPAALLIVVLLGSIAVDFSTVFLAHRDLLSAAGAAANDAVTYGLDEAHYRETGEYVLDPRRVALAVRLSLEARGLAGRVGRPAIAIRGRTVAVTLTERVRYVLGAAIPGVPHETTVRATGSAAAIIA